MESLLAAEKNNEVVSEWPSSVFALLPPDSFFDSVIRIAVSISNMPYAVVMHNEQQGRRIVSSLGMDEVDPDDCMDLCATALNHEKFQEISDLSEESSCSDNSLVEGIPSLKFFKGIPLRVAEKTIGMLAVMHEDPNSLTALQRGALEKLVHVVDKVLQSYCKIPPLDRFAAAKIIEQDIYIIDASTLQILYHCACSNDKTRPIELRTLAGSMLDRLVSQDLIAFTGHVAPLRAGTHDVVEFESVFQEPGQQAKTVSLQVLADKGDDTGLFTVIVSPSADAQQRKVDLHGLVDSLPGAFIYRMHKSSSWITGYVSRGYHELTGRNPEEIIGSKIAVAQLIAHPEDKERAWNVICAALKAHKPFELTYRIVVVGSANELRWVREQGRGKYTESGQLLAVEGVVFDVTREQQHSTKLGYQASHDYLTGMCNRREFEHRLARALQNAKAKNSEHALCFLDLDQFKVVNDTCGHRAGDELLRKLNSVLNSVTRQRDTLARLGGDEFGILMEHCALQEARRVATMVRDGIRELEFNWEGKIFRVGVSIGIAMVTADIEDPTVLLQMADRSCYAAKRQGGNRIHVYQGDDDFPTYQDEAQWVSRVNRALADNSFQLYRQKMIPADDLEQKQHSYEVLLRMIGDDKQVISPEKFLGAAETYHIAPRIDRWVIRQVFSWLANNPSELQKLRMCSINLSGQSLTDEEFPAFITYQLQRTRIPADKICFEITETAAITNLTRARHFVDILRNIGFRFALDDFGNGLSSFAYLKYLPVDFVKIDGLFVQNVIDDSSDQAVISAITHIAHLMGKRVIAEWVESDAVRDKLLKLNVDWVQGFNIEKPRLIETLAELPE